MPAVKKTTSSSATPTRPKLLLIDGHSVAYRAFFALPVENFSTQTGQHTNGVFGFTSMLINVLRDEPPTHLAVAFDVSRQTFRSELYAEYKANRSTSPDEFKGQVDLVKEVLDALNVPHLGVEGYEADDVIATLASEAEQAGYDVLICTGDRDAFQLVSDRVTVLYPRKGVSDLARMTPEAVEERYFVAPARYPELAALVGESSDNLPGIPGVGPKTAAKWLTTYDGLDNLITHAGELRARPPRRSRSGSTRSAINRQVNALVRDLDLPLGIDDFERRPWDREATHQLFDQLEFRVLRDRLLEALPNEEIVPEGGFELSGVILQPGELVGLAGRARRRRPDGSRRDRALGFRHRRHPGHRPGRGGRRSGVRGRHRAAACRRERAGRLAGRPRQTQGHARRQRGRCWRSGPVVGSSPDSTSDTQLAAYLVRPDQRTYDLADLTIRYLKRELKVDTGPTCSTPPPTTSWRSTSATTTPAPRWRPRRRWCAPAP